MCKLANFESYESNYSEEDGYQEEAHHNLRFRDGPLGILPLGLDLPGWHLEVVMQGRHLEDALAHAALALRDLEIEHLNHHREVFNKEDGAQDGNEQLLAYEDGKHGNDATQAQAARIAHEHLRRIGVIPQEADGGADKCRSIHHQL